MKEDMKPADPVSENMNALTGKPMRAFIYQDHDAHIKTHTSFMQDPAVTQMIGQNPQANQIMASLQAHIAEHLAFNYRKQIEERLGAPLPKPNEELPEDVEVNLARLVADAGQQLTQAHQQQAAQQAAQAAAQDPVNQMRQQELNIRQADLQRKAQKDATESQLKQREQTRKEKKDAVDARLETEQIKINKAEIAIDAQKAGAKIKEDSRLNKGKLELDVMKTMKGK